MRYCVCVCGQITTKGSGDDDDEEGFPLVYVAVGGVALLVVAGAAVFLIRRH